MTTTRRPATTAPAPYAVGQHLEVLRTDFAQRDMPKVWMPATVEHVEALDGGLFDISLRFSPEYLQVVRCGRRGGNAGTVRVAA